MKVLAIASIGLAAALTICLPLRGNAWDGEPAPPYPPRPSASSPPRRLPPPRYAYPPPPPYAYPAPPIVAPPPPLSPVMRALYAPFYVAGLVVRYGFYYAVVAPIEVFDRTVAYGARGGVERRSE
jgi:hypothetical protein